MRARVGRALLLAVALVTAAGCVGETGGGAGPPGSASTDTPPSFDAGDDPTATGPPVTLRVLAGSELKDMEPILDGIAERTGVSLDIEYTGTLTGTERILAGDDVDLAWFSHAKYLELEAAGTGQVVASTPIMLSPVTIGVRRAAAERLGWGNRDVSWADVAEASAAGQLRFAMANPSASNSGLTALVAVATAEADTGAAITAGDVAALDLRGAFKGQALTAGSSGWLADAFAAEGEDLDAMVNYESILAADDGLAILYPTEGVVTADYPLVLLDPGAEAAYDRLVAALLDPAVQAEITDRTLRRPVVPGVARAAAIPPIDPNEVPFPATVAAIDALLFAYLDEDRAPAHTIYVLDTSGSMEGEPLDNLKAALTQLTGVDGSLAGRFTRFRQRERVTMLPFSTTVDQPTTFEIDDVGDGSPVLAELRDYIAGLTAGGDTNLYGALDAAYRLAAEARAGDPDRFYSVVLLSDGAATTGPDLDEVREGVLGSPDVAGVRTFPVLFGQSDGPAMDKVADATGGLVFDSSGNLTSAFKTIRGWQ